MILPMRKKQSFDKAIKISACKNMIIYIIIKNGISKAISCRFSKLLLIVSKRNVIVINCLSVFWGILGTDLEMKGPSPEFLY